MSRSETVCGFFMPRAAARTSRPAGFCFSAIFLNLSLISFTRFENLLLLSRSVKFRHAAALALTGWYLMVPPIDNLARQLAGQQEWPLSTWEHYASYDTAKECESAKSDLARDAVKDENAQNCVSSDMARFKGPTCQYDFSKENARGQKRQRN